MANPADEIAKALEALWTKGGDDATRAVADDVIKGRGLDVSPPVSPDVAAKWDDYARNFKYDTAESGPVFLPSGEMSSATGTRAAETDNYWRSVAERNPIMAEANDALDAADAIPAGGGRNAQRKAILSHEAQQLRLLGPSALGAAGTVLAGGALLGAGQAKAQDKGGDEVLWTPERVQKFLAKPRAQQEAILDKLTDAEFEELRAAREALKASPSTVNVGGAKVLKSASVQPPLQQSEAQAVQPYYDVLKQPQPEQSLFQRAKAAVGDVYDATLKPAVDAVGQWQKENVTPIVKQGQYLNRELAEGNLGALPQAVAGFLSPGLTAAQGVRDAANLVSPGAGLLAEQVTALPLGPPEEKRSPEQMDAARLDFANNVAPVTRGAMRAAIPALNLTSDVTTDAFTEGLAAEAAYLPLYLIDAPAKAGRLGRALIGGGASELADPREGSNALRGTLFAGGIGLALEGIIKGAAQAGRMVDAAKAKRAIQAMPEIAPKGVQSVVVDADVLKEAVERGGAELPQAAKIRKFVDERMPAINMKQAIDPTIRDAATGERIMDPGEVPPLHELPQKDTAILWDDGSGQMKAEVLSADDIALRALKYRDPVVVQTPEGPKLGLWRASDKVNGVNQHVVAPFDPEERIANSISEPMLILGDGKMERAISDSGRPNNMLKVALEERKALLEREAEEAADAAREPVTPEDMAPPNQPPPPPDGSGPGGMGTPPPPPPPDMLPLGENPPLQRITDRFVDNLRKRVPKWMQDTLLSPTNKASDLDLSNAANSMKAADSMDIIAARTNQQIQAALAPSYTKLPQPEQVKVQQAITRFLKSNSATLADLERQFPDVVRDVRVQVEDLKARSQLNQQKLRALGALNEKALDAPKGFEDFVRGVLEDENYLMQAYLSKLLPAGEYSKWVKANETRLEQLQEAAYQQVKKSYLKSGQAIDDAAIREKAEQQVDRLMRDPDALADEEFMREVSGRGKLRAKKAGTWEAASRVLDAYAQVKPEVAAAARKYVEGKASAPPEGIDPKDIKFLKAAREEYAELMPAWVRMALGEITDPFTLAPLSVARQEELLVKAQAVSDLAKAGRIMTLEDWVLAGKPEGWKRTSTRKDVWGKYASVDGREGAPGRDFYVSPDAHDAITRFSEQLARLKQLVNEARGIAEKVPGAKVGYGAYDFFRAAKTSLSVSAWWQNIFGNVRGIMLSGVMTPWDIIARKGDSWRSFADSISQWRDFAARPNAVSKPGEMTGADWIREGIRHGTIGSDWMTHEHREVFKRLAGAMAAKGADVSLSPFAQMMTYVVKGNRFVSGVYALPDQISKHAVWLAGLKRGGIDVKTGQLTDKKAAVRFVFGTGLNQRRMSIDALSQFPDAKLAEMVKRASAQRVAQSFAMPDRAGKVGQYAGAAATASAGQLANPFVRTAMEESRILAQLPGRALTQDGVASSLLQYGLLMGGIGAAIGLKKKMSGITPQQEQQSYMGLPQGQRAYTPAPWSIGDVDAQGRHRIVDISKFAEPLKWLSGDPQGLPVGVQAATTPGHLATRAAYNATVGSVFGAETPVGQWAQRYLAAAGMMEPQRQFTPRQPGAGAVLEGALRYLAPGTMMQADAAFDATQRGVAPEDAALQFLTGGFIKRGGTPEEAKKNIKSVEGQLKKELPRNVKAKDIGKPTGLFNTIDSADRDEAKTRRKEAKQQNKQTIQKLRGNQ